MKASELIALLQKVPGDAEIVTPGFDEYGAASAFTLKPVLIVFDYREGTTHFAPHETFDVDDTAARFLHQGSVAGYELNGEW